jgi:hypothetical protein
MDPVTLICTFMCYCYPIPKTFCISCTRKPNKKFSQSINLSFQDLAVKWTSDLTRRLGFGLGSSDQKGKRGGEKGKEGKKDKTTQKIPRWVCRKYNEGRCEFKEDRQVSLWDPNFFLRHVCSKWLTDRNRYCLETHPLNEHK